MHITVLTQNVFAGIAVTTQGAIIRMLVSQTVKYPGCRHGFNDEIQMCCIYLVRLLFLRLHLHLLYS